MAAFPVRDVREAVVAVRPAAGSRVAASVVGPDTGVAEVRAVAGVVPALRGEGGAGAVGERQQLVHVGVRGVGGVSGAGDGPNGGEPPAGDIVGDGGQHRGAGCGAAARRGSVREAEAVGIDEFSYRKRHRYLTLVVDHDERRVVWAGEGRSAETLGAFFKQLGPGGCARIELVTADLASSWQKALAEWVPHARVVFDRFHVEQLASDAVDEVRRSEQRRLDPADAKALKGTRYVLLKHPARLKPGEARRLEMLRRENRALDRAYELKEYLATILGQATPEDAPALLDEWLEWAARSRLVPFVKLGRTIRKHAEGILAYLDTRMTNGPVEGINNKLRVIARRAYGFHSAGALISMLFLCCGGIELAPPLPTLI